LTGNVALVTIDTVKTMTEVLRQAVLASGLPLQQIAEAAGVERASLSRFVRGQRTLRLDMADRLAAYLGLELKQTGRRARAHGPRRSGRPDGTAEHS
jgi:transcriptional regulator with XRE-family HTH domain